MCLDSLTLPVSFTIVLVQFLLNIFFALVLCLSVSIHASVCLSVNNNNNNNKYVCFCDKGCTSGQNHMLLHVGFSNVSGCDWICLFCTLKQPDVYVKATSLPMLLDG